MMKSIEEKFNIAWVCNLIEYDHMALLSVYQATDGYYLVNWAELDGEVETYYIFSCNRESFKSYLKGDVSLRHLQEGSLKTLKVRINAKDLIVDWHFVYDGVPEIHKAKNGSLFDPNHATLQAQVFANLLRSV